MKETTNQIWRVETEIGKGKVNCTYIFFAGRSNFSYYFPEQYKTVNEKKYQRIELTSANFRNLFGNTRPQLSLISKV